MVSSKEFSVIATEYGPIKGCKKMSILGREYFNYQKIPYMKPPIGKLRFRDAQPPEPWSEPLDCTEQGPAFPNMNFLTNEFEGELDSMFINIYTNNINPSKPYPVMVSIHGGGIYTGNAQTDWYGPDYLMQKDVILVTFQYRMGVFGFLSLDDKDLNIPGNAQFKDHIMALKWIKNNIKNFGGDPENITLFGESWGGGSTNYHMISDKSKGLFNRGILMSGCALNPYYSSIPRRQWGMRLCLKLGYSGQMEENKFLEYLEEADPKDIVKASTELMTDKEKYIENLNFGFGPTIEPYDNGNCFLSNDIITMAHDCWGNGIDIMIGATSNETSSISIPVKAKVEGIIEKLSYFNRYIPRELELQIDGEKCNEYAKLLKKNYYGLLEPSITNLEGLMHVSNDHAIWHPAHRIILSRLNSGDRSKSFVYRFDVDSENNLFKKFLKIDENIREPMHGDDIAYLFKMNLGPAPPIESPAFEAIKLMLAIWTNFAATGNPNVPEIGVEWEPTTTDVPLHGINITEKGCKIIDFPEAERMKLLDSFFKEQTITLY